MDLQRIGSESAPCRVDLHLHSRASTDTGNWFLKRAALPESFTDPLVAYRAAKRRGMRFVTLTDHNTLDGVAEIAHLDDVFVSVEITTQFPEDGVPLHVLVWGLNDEDWQVLDHCRENVYELVDEIAERGLTHALAHPLQRLGSVLTADHIERFLLLFPVWEGINGSRSAAGNEVAQRIARSASREYLIKLADKHNLAPRGDGPPSLVAGSDDHALLDACSAYTETPPAASIGALLDFIAAGETTPRGTHGSTETLAHAMAALALGRYLEDGGRGIGGPVGRLIEELTGHRMVPGRGEEQSADGLRHQVMERARGNGHLIRSFVRTSRQSDSAERSHGLVRLVANWAHGDLASLATQAGPQGPRSFAERSQLLGGALGCAAPYLASAAYHRAESQFAEDVEVGFFGARTERAAAPRVALLTDTFDELNGVAGTMRRLSAYAARHPAANLTVMTCGRGGSSAGLHRLKPTLTMPVPAYGERSWRLGMPSILDLLAEVERREIEVIHAVTPGPMGLAGLLVARALQLRFVASHHTELARYAMALTGDRLALQLTGLANGWFLGQAERVFVSSNFCASELTAEGIGADALEPFGRGLDPKQFSPTRRSAVTRQRLGGRSGTVLLYVGRISREKGIFRLADAVCELSASRPELTLVIVGDGPDRAAFEERLRGVRHRFVGTLRGSSLATVYASADIFCLPSETETFGQVITEAQASGLPVVVTDRGAAHEQVEDGVTGLVARVGVAGSLATDLARLIDDPTLRQSMGKAARQAALARPTWDRVFDDLVARYAALVAAPTAPAPSALRQFESAA